MGDGSRPARTPNANNPALVGRLLETVATGVRSTRALAELLAVDARTVQYYTQAGQWLGMLDGEGSLTRIGLEYVYGGTHRPDIYARAVWAVDFAAALLADAGRDRVPSSDAVASAIRMSEPELAPSTVERRASAVRSLIAPAVGRGGATLARGSAQLTLPLVASSTSSAVRCPATAKEYDADVYRFVYASLLAYGELSVGNLRALLDQAGAPAAPLGGYIDLVLRRGDAHRVGERLVVSAGGIARSTMAGSTSSLLLSDPGYRRDLETRLAGGPGAVGPIGGRYRSWDKRLFGGVPKDGLQAAVDGVLLERSLSAFPIAGGPSEAPQPIHASFLDVWERPGLTLALPPTIGDLQGGLSSLNRGLSRARRTGDVRTPSIVDRPSCVHGTLFHPGEPMTGSIPDLRSLRARVLSNLPHAALTAALLLLHRSRHGRVALVQARRGWSVKISGRILGRLFDLLSGFAIHRGWAWSSGPGTPSDEVFLDALECVGVVVQLGGVAVLDEALFSRLRVAVDEAAMHAQLAPLSDALGSWLDQHRQAAA
jgi:hypothetical protein